MNNKYISISTVFQLMLINTVKKEVKSDKEKWNNLLPDEDHLQPRKCYHIGLN